MQVRLSTIHLTLPDQKKKHLLTLRWALTLRYYFVLLKLSIQKPEPELLSNIGPRHTTYLAITPLGNNMLA